MPLNSPAPPHLSTPAPFLAFLLRGADVDTSAFPALGVSVCQSHHISSSGPSLYLAPLHLAISIPTHGGRDRKISVPATRSRADKTQPQARQQPKALGDLSDPRQPRTKDKDETPLHTLLTPFGSKMLILSPLGEGEEEVVSPW